MVSDPAQDGPHSLYRYLNIQVCCLKCDFQHFAECLTQSWNSCAQSDRASVDYFRNASYTCFSTHYFAPTHVQLLEADVPKMI